MKGDQKQAEKDRSDNPILTRSHGTVGQQGMRLSICGAAHSGALQQYQRQGGIGVGPVVLTQVKAGKPLKAQKVTASEVISKEVLQQGPTS